MNAEDSERVIREGVDAWNRGDLEAMQTLFAPDSYIHTTGAFPGIGPEYIGRDGLAEFWREFRGGFERIEIVIESLEQFGRATLGTTTFVATGRDDLKVELAIYQVFEIQDGQVIGFTANLERDDALAVVRSLEDNGHAVGAG